MVPSIQNKRQNYNDDEEEEMKKQIPKNCLTCKFMDFEDDDLNVLMCKHERHKTHHDPDGIIVDDDYYCTYYELNKSVQKDADQGCW